jgi:MFS family permease
VQGAGAALVAPAALSLITTSFPPGPRRTRAIGLYGSMASVGFVAGQVLGGVLVEWTSWRAVFLVNVPVGLAAAFLAPRLIAAPAGKASPGRAAALGAQQRGRRLDLRGAVLITAAVALAVFGISQGDVLGWTSPLVLGAAVIAVGAAACFVVAETRHPAPLVRPRLLLRPGLRNGATLAFLLGVWNGGELLVLSLYMQQVLHFSPLSTGLIIAPQGVAGFTMGMLGPKLAGRFGVRRVAMAAGVSATIGFAALTQLPAVGYSPLLFVVILVGFGGAGTAFGSIVLASRELSDDDQGLAGGVVNTSRQLGAAVGAALLPAVAASVSGVSGDRAAMLAATAAALAATVVSWHAARQASLLPAGGRPPCTPRHSEGLAPP